MTDGLPADVVAIGWEKDDACAAPEPDTAEAPQLASTGTESASLVGFGAGALGLALVGLGFMVATRRRTRA
jgi:hypothetical protein